MRNGKQNYASEIAAADNFIKNNRFDIKLSGFLRSLEGNVKLMHSDRWSLVYDFMQSNYPDKMDLVTGITYWLEG